MSICLSFRCPGRLAIVDGCFPELPKFELDGSGLLRGLIDGTMAQIWEFWGDGEYPDDQKLKQEADRLVDDVLASSSDSDLVEFGKTDSWVKAGKAEQRGINDAEDPIGHRHQQMAMRVIEVALEHARYGIDRQALLHDPLPTRTTLFRRSQISGRRLRLATSSCP